MHLKIMSYFSKLIPYNFNVFNMLQAFKLIMYQIMCDNIFTDVSISFTGARLICLMLNCVFDVLVYGPQYIFFAMVHF